LKGINPDRKEKKRRRKGGGYGGGNIRLKVMRI
jgi:hypothetical protein